jgi:electron transfer flavoprotein alpha subunit
MLSDVMAMDSLDGVWHYERPLFAGNARARLTLAGDARVLTVRASSFEAPARRDGDSPVLSVEVDADSLPRGMEFVSREQSKSGRPDPGEARVVIGGGRPLKDAETFERLIGALADLLGGAAATTRAAVDGGIAPNELQVGQTGKIIAPDLYIAAGISGAIQHMAGIRDSRVIVAINKDPEAPIFEVATYGLVGDLFKVLPELMEAVGRD